MELGVRGRRAVGSPGRRQLWNDVARVSLGWLLFSAPSSAWGLTGPADRVRTEDGGTKAAGGVRFENQGLSTPSSFPCCLFSVVPPGKAMQTSGRLSHPSPSSQRMHLSEGASAPLAELPDLPTRTHLLRYLLFSVASPISARPLPASVPRLSLGLGMACIKECPDFLPRISVCTWHLELTH